MRHKLMRFAGFFVALLMAAGIYSTQSWAGAKPGPGLSEPLAMDPVESTLRLAFYAPLTLDEAYPIARKKLSEETGCDIGFDDVFSIGERYYFFALVPPNKKQGERAPISEWGVYVDIETGQAQYVQSERTFARPACRSEYERGSLGGQLRLLNRMYDKKSKGKPDN